MDCIAIQGHGDIGPELQRRSGSVVLCKHCSLDGKVFWQPEAKEDHEVIVSTVAYRERFPQCNTPPIYTPSVEGFPNKAVTVLLRSSALSPKYKTSALLVEGFPS